MTEPNTIVATMHSLNSFILGMSAVLFIASPLHSAFCASGIMRGMDSVVHIEECVGALWFVSR